METIGTLVKKRKKNKGGVVTQSMSTHISFKKNYVQITFQNFAWVVSELLGRSLLIACRKNDILSIALVLFGAEDRHHWWLLFRAAAT